MHWKYWAILATLAWTLWALGVKLALQKVNWARLEILSAIGGLLIIACVAPAAYRFRFNAADGIGLLAGMLGAAGGVLFFISVSKGPVSVIIPLTSLYIVGVAAGGILFFGESLTWRKALAVVLAGAAIALLAAKD